MDKRKILIGCLFVGSIFVSVFLFYFYQVFTTANILVKKESTSLYIPEGTNFEQLQKILYDRDIVQDMVSFSFVAKILKYQNNVKPGHYVLKPDQTNLKAIKMLRAGEQVPVRVTFNNIRTKKELAKEVCQSLELKDTELLKLLNDSTITQKYGLDTMNIVSIFLPNTYEFYWNVSATELLDRMNGHYNSFWNDERISKANNLKLKPKEISVLASIVHAESKVHHEQNIIAGVYLNRLKKGMLLQADPTLIFALDDYEIRRVTNKMKETDSPYNTYKYTGLPPSPINIPPIHTIDAVLDFKEHKYLYFCAKEDLSGEHNFSRSYKQHLLNAKKYHRALNKAGIY